MQSNSATERIVSTLLMTFMTHLRFSTALTRVAVSTGLDRGLALSSDFVCRLLLNFYPRFQVSYPPINRLTTQFFPVEATLSLWIP